MKVTVKTSLLSPGCYIHNASFYEPGTKKLMSCEYRGAQNPCWSWHKARALKNQIVYNLQKAGYRINRNNINFKIIPFLF